MPSPKHLAVMALVTLVTIYAVQRVAPLKTFVYGA